MALFIASRISILAANPNRHHNWEEPVFHFSASELASNGLSGIFDHQDDLNHGGSLPLVLLGIPWLAVSGDDLQVFKGLAIVWSTLTLMAHMFVGWRYFSPPVGLLWGVFYVAASGASSRLNVTLIGSHPEVLLPVAIALGLYLEGLRRETHGGHAPRWIVACLGLWCAISVWFSYAAVVFILPVLACWSMSRPTPGSLRAFAAGAVPGALPWLYQNVILRPHGALAFLPRVRNVSTDDDPTPWAWNGLLASFESGFGPPEPTGPWGLTLIALAATLSISIVLRTRNRPAGEWRIVGPFLLAPLVGLAALAMTSVNFYRWDGFANYRYFVPVQAAIYWVIAIGAGGLRRNASLIVSGLIAATVLLHGAWAQRTLHTRSIPPSKYKPIFSDPDALRLAGCRVFGHAEVDRSANFAIGRERLESLRDPVCCDVALANYRRVYRRKYPRIAARVPLLEGDNVIVVNIDTLRADHLGCYGYDRETSPFIDSLAREGVLFENTLASSSFTRESVATLLTGRLPTCGGSLGWNAEPPRATMAALFKKAGYRTGFFSNTVMLRAPGFTDGFDEAHHLPKSWGLSGRGEQLSDQVLDFIEETGNQRFMIYVHYLDPHGPYRPQGKPARQLVPDRGAGYVPLYSGVRQQLPELQKSGYGPGDSRFEELVARYDAEIAMTDAAIERLVGGLREAGLDKRTLIVITADHGEEFLEHGYVEHAWTLYRESVHIPFILWAPSALPPMRVAVPNTSADLLPTLLDLTGVDAQGVEFEGRSLLRRDGHRTSFEREDAPIVSELLLRERNVLRSMVSGRWKYIAAQRWLPPDQRPTAIEAEKSARESDYAGLPDSRSPVVWEELYDIEIDPGESDNLAQREPEKLVAMRTALADYVQSCESPVTSVSRENPAALDPAEKERMRALGY